MSSITSTLSLKTFPHDINVPNVYQWYITVHWSKIAIVTNSIFSEQKQLMPLTSITVLWQHQFDDISPVLTPTFTESSSLEIFGWPSPTCNLITYWSALFHLYMLTLHANTVNQSLAFQQSHKATPSATRVVCCADHQTARVMPLQRGIRVRLVCKLGVQRQFQHIEDTSCHRSMKYITSYN